MKRDEMSASTKVFIQVNGANREPAGLGLGVVRLCERVDELGSLNRAAIDMGMAYSKAWRIVKRTEEGLGISLFVRKGARGSCLTEEAKALIALYRRVERAANEGANAELRRGLDELGGAEALLSPGVPEIETKATPELIAQVRALGL